MALLKSFQRYQCQRWNSNIIDFLGEYEDICETATVGRESGPSGDCLMKKNRGSKISCHCPFNEKNFWFPILKVSRIIRITLQAKGTGIIYCTAKYRVEVKYKVLRKFNNVSDKISRKSAQIGLLFKFDKRYRARIDFGGFKGFQFYIATLNSWTSLLIYLFENSKAAEGNSGTRFPTLVFSISNITIPWFMS
jgi:hypothetical protein